MAKIVVPANAWPQHRRSSSPLSATVVLLPKNISQPRDSLGVSSVAVDLGPHGLNLNAPIFVALPCKEPPHNANKSVHVFDIESKSWLRLQYPKEKQSELEIAWSLTSTLSLHAAFWVFFNTSSALPEQRDIPSSTTFFVPIIAGSLVGTAFVLILAAVVYYARVVKGSKRRANLIYDSGTHTTVSQIVDVENNVTVSASIVTVPASTQFSSELKEEKPGTENKSLTYDDDLNREFNVGRKQSDSPSNVSRCALPSLDPTLFYGLEGRTLQMSMFAKSANHAKEGAGALADTDEHTATGVLDEESACHGLAPIGGTALTGTATDPNTFYFGEATANCSSLQHERGSHGSASDSDSASHTNTGGMSSGAGETFQVIFCHFKFPDISIFDRVNYI
jgi:uncharacterized membrane protein YgcG